MGEYMGKKVEQSAKRAKPKDRKTLFAAIGLIAIAVAGFVIAGVYFSRNGSTASDNVSTVNAAGDLVISKDGITENVKFFPYKAGNVKMEVLAVKASDGTIRTAFNTCQVCYDSGRGYYEQDGSELVCQNCGNRFHLDQIELMRGGCNPVPILEDFKTDDGTNIIIAQSLLEEASVLFGNWKK